MMWVSNPAFWRKLARKYFGFPQLLQNCGGCVSQQVIARQFVAARRRNHLSEEYVAPPPRLDFQIAKTAKPT